MICKRIFDVIASLLGLLALSPLFVLISVLIKIFTPGPVFFMQKRIGKEGKVFTIVKFRTMKLNHTGNTISIKGEDRITPLGALLRKYKIDELPELWNIFVGEMSFVGPRPDVKEYTDRLVGIEKKILDLRPGLTGPASIKYANEESILQGVPDPQRYTDEVIWPDKVKLNLNYYYNRSFFGDIGYIFKTIF